MDLEFTRSIRCYNGAFDSETQRVLDNQKRALDMIRTKEPEAHVTHFPMEGGWCVHVWGRELSSFCNTKGAALYSAMFRLGIPG